MKYKVISMSNQESYYNMSINNEMTTKKACIALISYADTKTIKSKSFFGKIVKEFKESYDESNLPYTEITEVVYAEDFGEHNIILVEENIKHINLILEESSCDKKYLNIAPKLLRHYDLAYIQKNFILKNGKEAQEIAEKAKEVSEKAKEVSENVEKDTKQSQEKLKQIENIKGQIYTEFIAILGIFSALIFGLFGGFDAISNIVQTTFKAGVELPNIMIAISLTLGSLSLLLFSLMQGIKILSKSTLKSCGCSNGENCDHSIFKRHPVMSLNLITLSSIFIVSLLVKLYPENTYSWIDNYFVTYLILVGIGVVFITFMLWFLLKKNKVEDSYH